MDVFIIKKIFIKNYLSLLLTTMLGGEEMLMFCCLLFQDLAAMRLVDLSICRATLG